MAEEKFAVNVESSKTVEDANDRFEIPNTLTTPKDEISNEEAAISLQKSNEFKGNEDPAIYQIDVVESDPEGEPPTTTEKPATEPSSEEGEVTTAKPTTTESETEAAAEPAEETEIPTEAAAAPSTDAPTEALAEVPTEAPAEALTEAPTEMTTELPSTADQPPERERKSSVQLAQPREAALKEETTTETTVAPQTSEQPKDPYALDIPVGKKINKRTQRKLWEEIEKRKPLIPKHVAEHIQKYAKPPFETWSCKFRGKGSCFGCK